MTRISTAALLRERLDNDESLQFMGAGDVLTAKLIEEAGFAGIAVQSFQATFQAGIPDGMMTPSEDADLCFRIAGEVETPILYDMFNGFGGPAQACFWMQRFERAGVAAIHLDDLTGEYVGGAAAASATARVEPMERTCDKIARMARERTTELVIVARTLVDVCEGFGVDDAVERLQEYKRAGADVLWAPLSITDDETMTRVRSELVGPLVAQSCPSGYYPLMVRYRNYIAQLTFSRAHAIGVQMYIFPQLNVIGFNAMKTALEMIKGADTIEVVGDQMWDFEHTIRLGGYRRYGIGYS